MDQLSMRNVERVACIVELLLKELSLHSVWCSQILFYGLQL